MSDLATMHWGGLAVAAGALLLYCASPNQRLLAAAKVSARPLAAAGLAIALAGLALLLASAGPATALFIAATALMLAWTIVPLAAAWWRRPPGDPK